jgi:hypothetical protein
MKRATLLSLTAASLILACQSDQPVGPKHNIAAAISDGGHSGGNQHFFFLPPMVAPPLPTFSGTFDASVQPVVEICKLGTNGVCPLIKRFPFGGPFNPFQFWLAFNSVQVAAQAQVYLALWRPNWGPAFDATAIYRVRVLSNQTNGQALGVADVKIVSSEDQFEAVWASKEFVPMVQGGLLAIDFRIEQGALTGTQCSGQPDCVQQTVGPNPTTRLDVVTPSGKGAVSFPPGYFTQQVTLTVSQVLEGCFSGSTFPAFGCYSFSTSPRVDDPLFCQANPTAATCARVEVCPTLAPTDSRYPHLELVKSDPDQPVQTLPGTTATLVTCQTTIGLRAHSVVDFARASWRSVTDVLGRLATPAPLYGATAMVHSGLGGLTCCFSHIGWALPVTITPQTPTNGSAPTGATVPVTVLVRALHPPSEFAPPLSGVQVTFAATPGNGTVNAVSVTTGSDGMASTQWTLGTGLNSVQARAAASGSPVTFTAIGTLLVRPSSDGLTAQPGVTLPLTLTSGLSMQGSAVAGGMGTGIQLEVAPATAVTWSSSDPSGTTASVNTTGLLVVSQGNVDPSTAHEATISAAVGSTPVGSIKVNSFSFAFPRLTTLVWRPVAGAASYDVTVEFGNGPNFTPCSTPVACTIWRPQLTAHTANLRFVFNFIGAGPGRWRVVASDATGAPISTSEDVYFGYIS